MPRDQAIHRQRAVLVLVALAAQALLPSLNFSYSRSLPLQSQSTKSLHTKAALHRAFATGARALPLESAEALQAAGELGSSLQVAFADQGSNLAGKFFQFSLPPYLLFLYFLGFKNNNTPPLAFFGFCFLLLFVLSTIPAGIISKSTWGVSLADCDWLHGTAEFLLTVTNVLLVLGFRAAILKDDKGAEGESARAAASVLVVMCGLAIAAGVAIFHWQAHDLFLSGVGDLSSDTIAGFTSVKEPENALSIPTWAVHFSSVVEFLVALSLIWRYSESTRNPRWKGLAWGMVPLHASGVAACTYHLFYNQPGLAWMVTLQAGLTFVGNATLCLGAARIAISNGWTVSELNPLAAFSKLTGEKKEEAKSFDPVRLADPPSDAGLELQPGPVLAVELLLVTVVLAYLTKYGELAVGYSLFSSESTFLALLFLVTPPAILSYFLVQKSQDLRSGSFPAMGLGEALRSPAT